MPGETARGGWVSGSRGRGADARGSLLGPRCGATWRTSTWSPLEFSGRPLFAIEPAGGCLRPAGAAAPAAFAGRSPALSRRTMIDRPWSSVLCRDVMACMLIRALLHEYAYAASRQNWVLRQKQGRMPVIYISGRALTDVACIEVAAGCLRLSDPY